MGSKLGHPHVPGVVHLSSICKAWQAAAQQTRGLTITWHSHQLKPYENESSRQQQVERSFRPWLARWGPQVDSFIIVSSGPWGGADLDILWCILNDAAKAAAAAGQPLRLQHLALPFTPAVTRGPPTALMQALPFLAHLSLSLDTWPHHTMPERMGSFLSALGNLHHLHTLEVGLRVDTPWVDQQGPLRCWQALLEAAPTQLQALSVQLIHRDSTYQGLMEVPYTWEPLAPFSQLQRLVVGDIAAGHDLAPLAHQLPALTSLGVKYTCGGSIQPLVAVKGLLRDLQIQGLCSGDQQHLEQLTHLTSLTMTWGRAQATQCPLPQVVAAGLQQLDWTLDGSSSSSRGGRTPGQQLAQCSSSKLVDLQLRGAAWTQEAAGAAEALRQLTGLTSFGLHCMRKASAPAVRLGTWPSQPPLAHLKQLRSLAVPVELLGTEQPWLGGLPHLTRLHMAVEWSSETAAGAWGPGEVFGWGQASILANLHSCWPTLKVLEVHIALLYVGRVTGALPVVAAVEGWLKQQLPGVYVVLTWRADHDVSQHYMAAMLADSMHLCSDDSDVLDELDTLADDYFLSD
jgi:hypothetical protein